MDVVPCVVVVGVVVVVGMGVVAVAVVIVVVAVVAVAKQALGMCPYSVPICLMFATSEDLHHMHTHEHSRGSDNHNGYGTLIELCFSPRGSALNNNGF